MAEREERRAKVELQIIEKPQEHSCKELEGPVQHSPANSANGDEMDPVEELFQEKVLGCLHRSTKPRKWAITILVWPYLFTIHRLLKKYFLPSVHFNNFHSSWYDYQSV